ncbi:helicase associated domain-containing protein [Cellulosimicrobium funkei]|uniref:Helicase-associated domain-containing protein n=1 Tax=Cellulosimicrobium funkei TaxID=264251 RepID=A0A4Y8QY96_9MICO|nr:helicase associated domain-containing protein [Cellulosimicrobium funkei]TFF04399.1 hypothetical protein E1O70_18305 [Cellulosimicrobium funkei]TGA67936.1 hypothetical protein EQW79_018485 [Cellulosimicrobium terreum]
MSAARVPSMPGDWDLFLRELDWWVAEHGNARVPQHATSRPVDGKPYPLGRHVSKLRVRKAMDGLDPELAAQLESRTGWAWDAASAQWQEKAAQLRAYFDEHGSLDGLTANQRAVGAWLVRQRARVDELTDAQQQALRAIPGALEDRKSMVDPFVDRVHTWLAAHPGATAADIAVKTTLTLADGTEVALGKQASNYRTRYAAGKLDDASARKIESLPGWTWGPRTDLWWQRLGELRAHHRAHRSLAGLSAANPTLQTWLRQQPSRALTPERAVALAQVPGALPTVSKTEEIVLAARAWLGQDTSRTLSSVTTRTKLELPDGTTVPLGRRLAELRRAHAAGELSPTDIETVATLPGWTWQRGAHA